MASSPTDQKQNVTISLSRQVLKKARDPRCSPGDFD